MWNILLNIYIKFLIKNEAGSKNNNRGLLIASETKKLNQLAPNDNS